MMPNNIFTFIKFCILLIIATLILIALSMASVLLWSWLFFDFSILETVSKVGGWHRMVNVSIGITTMLIFLKSNTVKFLPIPMKVD